VTVADTAIRESLSECRAVTRARARNFYWGLRLTPEPRRSALFAIYAWMRAGDDAADDPGEMAERRARLSRFESATRSLLWGEGDGAAPSGGCWPGLAWAVNTYGIDRRVLEDMMAGLREDLEPPRATDDGHGGGAASAYEDDEALDGYCERVGSTVGEACVSIWGLDPKRDTPEGRAEAMRLARVRGIAFQRTNILRDFAEDLAGDPPRVYLPASAFAAHGLTPVQLAAWSDDACCRALAGEQIGLAVRAYERSEALERMIRSDCRPVLRAMTAIYRGVLDRLERDPRRLAGERVRLSAWRKAAIAVRCGVAPRLGLAQA
jgi:phytoene synthase